MNNAVTEPDPSLTAGAGQQGGGAVGRRARILLVGNANVDVLMGDLAPWPQPGTEVVVDRYELRVGGAAGNTGLALAALGAGAQHGSELIAAVGEDALGH